MKVIINELKKLLKIKSIWILYIMGMVIVFYILFNFNFGPGPGVFHNQEYENKFNNLYIKFVDEYGNGPYDKELINQYATIYNEIVANCENNQTDSCYKNQIKTYDELKIYQNDNPADVIWYLLSFKFAEDNLDTYNNSIEWTKEDLQKLMSENKNFINQYFIQRAHDEKIGDLKNQLQSNTVEFFYPAFNFFSYQTPLFALSIIATLMLLISIASSFSADTSTNVDYLILTSKKGRKIIKNKIIAIMIADLFYSLILYLPFVLTILIKKRLYLFFRIPIKYSMNSWLNVTLLQFFIILIFLLFLTQIFIGLIFTIISIYSSKTINTVVYSTLLVSTIFVLMSYTGKLPVLHIALLHTPFGFISTNIKMLLYSTDFQVGYFDYTYPLYTLIYPLINIVIILILLFITIKYLYKKNY